jgi:hypothetical protein
MQKNKSKLLVNVYEPLIAIMKYKFDASCLKRDAYLDIALRHEIHCLRNEVTIPNSDKAYSYIANNLKQLKLKPLNMLLPTETIELINEVCKEKNIPRDAYINRFFLLLLASNTVLETLFDSLRPDDYSENDADWMLDSDDDRTHIDYELSGHTFDALDTIEDLLAIGPFWQLKNYLDKHSKINLYTYSFERYALSKLPKEYGPLIAASTIGFNTYMDDAEVSKQENNDIEVDEKAKTDAFLAFMQQEKLARREKQQETKKAKPSPSENSVFTEPTGES